MSFCFSWVPLWWVFSRGAGCSLVVLCGYSCFRNIVGCETLLIMCLASRDIFGREKGGTSSMFEEFSLSGGQALVVLFWVILGLIFVWGLIWGRIRAK